MWAGEPVRPLCRLGGAFLLRGDWMGEKNHGWTRMDTDVGRGVGSTTLPLRWRSLVERGLIGGEEPRMDADVGRGEISDVRCQQEERQGCRAVFPASLKSPICNPQSAIHNLQSTICNPRSAIRDLQSAICNLPSPHPPAFAHAGAGPTVPPGTYSVAMRLCLVSGLPQAR